MSIALVNVQSAITGLVVTRGLADFLTHPVPPLAALVRRPLPPYIIADRPGPPRVTGLPPTFYAPPDGAMTADDVWYGQARLGQF